MMNRMTDLSFKYGKPDMERLGVFIEMPYMNGKGYVSPFPKPRPDVGRNIMGEGRKIKNGTQHGYFDSEFRRLYEGEAIPRPPKRKSEEAPKKKKKLRGQISGRPFMPPGITKWHSCPGDYFGTFGGKIEAFGRETEPKPKHQKQKPNCLTGPAKKGGPGYPHLGLSKDYPHMPDPYGAKLIVKQYGFNRAGPIITVHYPQPYFDENPYKLEKPVPTYAPPKPQQFPIVGTGLWIPSGPAKWQGGCHAGMFSPIPPYMTERDKKKEKKAWNEKLKQRKAIAEQVKFLPQAMGVKKMLTRSVLCEKTDLSMNVTNYKNYEPVYTKRLL